MAGYPESFDRIVCAAVETAVEFCVETRPPHFRVNEGLAIRMMGCLTVSNCGLSVPLPKSRKMRALLCYLALAERPIGRNRLCELLGESASDPRAELRGYLSQIRSVLGSSGRERVVSANEMVSLHQAGVDIDAFEIERAVRAGLGTVPLEGLRQLEALFTGDFAEGLDLNRSPQLGHWLTTKRAQFRSHHAEILEELFRRLPSRDNEALRTAQKWVAIAPYDERAHIALKLSSEPADTRSQLTSAVRLMESGDMDAAALRVAWRSTGSRPAEAANGREGPLKMGSGEISDHSSVRTSLVVLPFQDAEEGLSPPGLGAGLTRDIITQLAKLRSLFVIAQGSVFALAERGIGASQAAQLLNVDYFANGQLRRSRGRIAVQVELVETLTSRIIWSEVYICAEESPFDVLDQICSTIVSAIVNQVEASEINRAVLKPPTSLNAWEAYHRGLWHMRRFTRDDNFKALQFFHRSIEADPTYSRAYSGVSFTHWQNAFQTWADNQREIDLAYEFASHALMADDLDPSAHWAIGRALWLRGDERQAIGELERAVGISPNFALGHYSLAFVHSQSGDPALAIRASDLSCKLSPYDPMLFGFLGAKAIAHARLGNYEEAADLAVKAAARPNAHILIQPIAAFCLALAGRVDEGRVIGSAIRRARPSFSVVEFLGAYKFSADAQALFRSAARQLGFC